LIKSVFKDEWLPTADEVGASVRAYRNRDEVNNVTLVMNYSKNACEIKIIYTEFSTRLAFIDGGEQTLRSAPTDSMAYLWEGWESIFRKGPLRLI